MLNRLATIVLFVATFTSNVGAQDRPPIRALGAVSARTTEPLAVVTSVRVLSDGRVIVNDARGRRVLLFDPSFSRFTVVADTTSATANAYSGQIGALLAFRGDSSLFVDPMSLSMLVIDPAGKIGRVIAIPRQQEAFALVGAGGAAFDPSGRLIFRAPNFRMPRLEAGGPVATQQPDTVPIVRMDLATRQLDTVAFVKIQRPNMNVTRGADGSVSVTSEINPLPVVDDWALLPDGSVAIVRGGDYHVDLIAPDGTRRSLPKVPFEWQRLSDEDKVAFIDSVRAVRERMRAAGGGEGAAAAAAGGAAGGQIIFQQRVEGGAARGGATPTPGAGPAPAFREPELRFISPDQLPDYKPAFFPNSARADAEGNLWIRTIPTRAIPGGPVYDVVNREGRLIDRVQVPEGRTIIGFGPGAAYLLSRDGNSAVLERASLR